MAPGFKQPKPPTGRRTTTRRASPAQGSATQLLVQPTSLPLTVKTSLQTIQQLLHGCISNLAMMRSMFRSDCYELKFYDFGEARAAQKNPQAGDAKPEKPPGHCFIGFRKGASGRVDRLIRLLDDGIADALRKGYLEALRLSIYEQESHPEDVLERWNFAFKYHADPASGLYTISSFEVTEQEKRHQSGTMTCSQAKQSLINFIQKVCGMSCSLPELPRSRLLAIDIDYTDQCPILYKAPGFDKELVHDSSLFTNDAWEGMTTAVASMSTGHHAVALSLEHLKSRHGHEKLGKVVPSRLRRDNTATEECATEPGPSTSLPSLQDQFLRGQSLPPTRATIPAQENSKTAPRKKSLATSISSSRSNAQHERDGVTPHAARSATEDLLAKTQFTSMLRPMATSSAVEETQVIAECYPSRKELSSPIENRLEFLQSKMDQLDNDRFPMSKRQGKITIIKPGESVGEVVISCMCEHHYEEGEMILCEFCDTFQHLHCHGYRGADDPRLPLVHICYLCLLGRKSKDLRLVHDEALRRRGFYLLQHTAFDSNYQLAKALGCKEKIATQLVKDFRSIGLIAPVKRGGKVNITSSHTKATTGLVNDTFFSPSKGIEKYLHGFLAPRTSTKSPSVDQPSASVQGVKRTAPLIDEVHTPQPRKSRRSARYHDAFDATDCVTPVTAKVVKESGE